MHADGLEMLEKEVLVIVVLVSQHRELLHVVIGVEYHGPVTVTDDVGIVTTVIPDYVIGILSCTHIDDASALVGFDSGLHRTVVQVHLHTGEPTLLISWTTVCLVNGTGCRSGFFLDDRNAARSNVVDFGLAGHSLGLNLFLSDGRIGNSAASRKIRLISVVSRSSRTAGEQGAYEHHQHHSLQFIILHHDIHLSFLVMAMGDLPHGIVDFVVVYAEYSLSGSFIRSCIPPSFIYQREGLLFFFPSPSCPRCRAAERRGTVIEDPTTGTLSIAAHATGTDAGVPGSEIRCG